MSVLKLIHRSLSDTDLRKLLGTDLKIVKYSDLANVQDLDALLPQPQDYCIVLYEEMPNAGHWTGLLKYDDRYEHFDSYGVAPDKELPSLDQSQNERKTERNNALPVEPPETGTLFVQHRKVPKRGALREYLRRPCGTPPVLPQEPKHDTSRLSRLHEAAEEGDTIQLRLHRG